MASLRHRYILASVAMSLGGFINGYDTGCIGAVTSMAQFRATVGPLSATEVGLTVSLVMLAGAAPSVVAGWLADRHGRLRVVVAGAVLFAAGALLQATAAALPQFLLGRAAAGLGEGVYLSTMSVYIAEISPTAARGALAGLPQLMATAGICAGYFTCYGSVHLESPDPVGSSMAWRLPFVVMVALAGLLVACCARLPESPRWLVSRGERTRALASLRRLDYPMAEAEREFFLREGAGAAVAGQGLSLTPWQSFALLFRRGYRARTVLALFVLGMAQLSGIDGVLYVRSDPYLARIVTYLPTWLTRW